MVSLNLAVDDEMLSLTFIYSGDYGERVVRNLINDPSFCKSCGLYCDYCKFALYSYVRNILAAIKLPDSLILPSFIDDPERYMPKKIPKADLCVASGLHQDLLLELPHRIEKSGIKGLIVPIEDFTEVPSGLRRQVEEACQELGLESAFPKPFCSLTSSEDHTLISRFVDEFKVGMPSVELSTVRRGDREVIDYAAVRRSAPCGSTWYVAKRLIGVETERKILFDAVAKAHHSYPCTATMSIDPELKEPILHVGGFIIRKQIEEALSFGSLL